ncbi:hypothetical protein N8I77_007037 [Diaporthe amygdali]|uniref:Metallo-beta-lactamase domain-containing protein n=1 Tax=Phomopsis amygdali TaxID=1214568 RepID=A0AAD9SCC7_PHOAM|nr:hypothetical protein N8I77_007037 [Diaporthe amygdali]
MTSDLQVDVYVAPAAPIGIKNEDPLKECFSPISCTLIQGPTSAVLVDTPATNELSEGLAEWIKKTAPGKKLRFIYTTHAHADHFLGNIIIQRQFPEAKCVTTSKVADAIKQDLAPGGLALWYQLFPDGQVPEGNTAPEALPADGRFAIDEHDFFGIDVPQGDIPASSFLHVPDL